MFYQDTHKIIKKFFFSAHNIKMLNTSQNNEIENINKEISLLQDRLETNEKKSKSI